MNQATLTTTSVTVLATVIVFTVLHQAKELFAPIITALLLGIILTPLSDIWDGLRVPSALSAFFSVTLSLLIILMMMLLLEPHVTQAVDQAPLIWSELRGTVDEFRSVLRSFEEISDEVVAAIEPSAAGGQNDEAGAVALPSITDALFYAPQFAAQILIFAGTLYFFLMVKNELYSRISATFSRFGENELRMASKQLSRYVLTISAINFSFGVIVTIVMQLINMPSPVLWGLLAFALNFVLYLGPIFLVSMLTITGIVVFDGAMSFLPAALYLGMNATEAQFVTPTLVGKSLAVNPLMVFLSLVFWLWLWGPIGGIIAIPLLIWGLTIVEGITSSTKPSAVLIRSDGPDLPS